MEKWKSERWKLRQAAVYVFAVIGVGFVVYGAAVGLFGGRVEAQQDPFLSRRIDALENRFYGVESRLGRVESDSRTTAITPRVLNSNDTEIQYLRTQVESLRTRLGEAECGLLKIDERTLTASARAARKQSAQSEVCRGQSGLPVQLSARP